MLKTRMPGQGVSHVLRLYVIGEDGLKDVAKFISLGNYRAISHLLNSKHRRSVQAGDSRQRVYCEW